MTTTETLRECIERGGRGEFAKALLELYRAPFWQTFDAACRAATIPEYSVLSDIARKVETTCSYYRIELRRHFPFLAHLDAPADEWPDLRGEQS